MNVPGSNLLSIAFTLICSDQFQYFKFSGTDTNSIGFEVVTFDAPVTVAGSVQAVDIANYENLGLDFEKRYIRIWTTQNLDDLERDRASDQIEWEGRRFEIIDQSDWYIQDGWNGCLFVEVSGP